MSRSLGIDIGGAHLKACLLTKKNRPFIENVGIYYTPIWKKGDQLSICLKKIKSEWNISVRDSIRITMSGEMADCFESRKAGVLSIQSIVSKIFKGNQIGVYSLNGINPIDLEKTDYLTVASANWHATATSLCKILKDCLLVDIGSTTTDIIPIKNGKILSPKRSTDFTRLKNGELIYLGVFRTPLSSLTNKIDFNGEKINVMRENFASTADIFRIVSKFNSKYDFSPTFDNRNKSILNSMKRVLRTIGLDHGDFSSQENYCLALSYKNQFLKEIKDNITKVQNIYNLQKCIPLILTGSGSFLSNDISSTISNNVELFSTLLSSFVQIHKSQLIEIDCCATAVSLTFIS